MIKVTAPHILDRYARPMNGHKPKVRQELVESFAKSENAKRNSRRSVNATYDAASSSDEYSNYWANADALDADSANSPAVRAKLVQRSRYEVANNGFADGIANTYADDLIGIGPQLRMQTGSEGFNRMIETAWFQWCKEIQFRRKLWCMAHAKHTDGEGIGVIRQNKKIKHKVKLDLVLHETEQCATPYMPFGQEGYVDGIRFDEFGNPVSFDLIKHPGNNIGWSSYTQAPEKVPAKYMLQWFKMKRPGQHRGVPESASTLNLGASGRRWREAVVAAAENIASHTLFIKTQFQPDEMDSVAPMSTLDIQKRMMTALPAGYDAFQPKAEQPTSTFSEFSKSLINEQARPKSMPYNKAACDSSSYNYASGRLDHQTYYGSLNIDRADCNDIVLDPLFVVWFEGAVTANGWLGGNFDALSPSAMAHEWDWPKHQVADIGSEADAADKNLKNGKTSLSAEYSLSGLDYEDEIVKTATSNGITVEQQRQINMLLNLPQHVIPIVSQLLRLVPEPKASAFVPAATTQPMEDNVRA